MARVSSSKLLFASLLDADRCLPSMARSYDQSVTSLDRIITFLFLPTSQCTHSFFRGKELSEEENTNRRERDEMRYVSLVLNDGNSPRLEYLETMRVRCLQRCPLPLSFNFFRWAPLTGVLCADELATRVPELILKFVVIYHDTNRESHFCFKYTYTGFLLKVGSWKYHGDSCFLIRYAFIVLHVSNINISQPGPIL